MAKTKRVKSRTGAKSRITNLKEKYGDVVTLIQDIDRKPGSPSRWKSDYTRQIFWLALAGMTEVEMANIIGISDRAFAVWKKNHPDFLAALQAGREEAVGVAAHSLFRSGVGFEHDAEKLIPNRIKEYDPHTGKVIKEYTEIMRVPYVKKYPPNVTALTKFLAAHKPEVWGDRSEVNHTGTVTHEMDITKLSKKQLKLLRKLRDSNNKAIENE
jgi:hypothetical protein